MSSRRVVVAGGGPAGFFAAIACAEAAPQLEVVLLEKGPQFLSKVRISGGGRCNVTHACFDPQQFASFYPRGGQALIGPFQAFQASHTVAWFESRGVRLKTERDGRIFPATDSSQTIVDCLLSAAGRARVSLVSNCGIDVARAETEGGFSLQLSRGEEMACGRLLLATGGCRVSALAQLPVSLGHTIEPPVPSLFTFQVQLAWLRSLAGTSVEAVEASLPGTTLKESGPLLLTHQGLSGPAILRLSAWGARTLHASGYRFPLRLNWLPRLSADQLSASLDSCRQTHPARRVASTPLAPLTARLWEQLVLAAGISQPTRWADLSRASRHALAQQLQRTDLLVTGKSLNRDEFVTCGGVRLGEVNFRTMESRICPGLHFAGELLDIDGLTGGYNFQAAWTTGWLAGNALAVTSPG